MSYSPGKDWHCQGLLQTLQILVFFLHSSVSIQSPFFFFSVFKLVLCSVKLSLVAPSLLAIVTLPAAFLVMMSFSLDKAGGCFAGS